MLTGQDIQAKAPFSACHNAATMATKSAFFEFFRQLRTLGFRQMAEDLGEDFLPILRILGNLCDKFIQTDQFHKRFEMKLGSTLGCSRHGFQLLQRVRM